ncbi:MAG: DUF423 domain-containing protein [Anaerolinea sp.]|nr:DUF423 domain-containing protein [Anaerolinea sp.]
MMRIFSIAGGLLGAAGVALGAFGAHGLSGFFETNPGAEATFRTAVQYHLIHAIALIGAAWATERFPSRPARLAGWLFLVGILLFSGSLYLLSIFGLRFMGAVAPLGGAALIAGWLSLALAAGRARPS